MGILTVWAYQCVDGTGGINNLSQNKNCFVIGWHPGARRRARLFLDRRIRYPFVRSIQP